MMTLIIGASCSGKSEYAERCLEDAGTGRIYIATMAARDAESLERVRRHRQRRAGKRYRTVECPTGLACAARKIPEDSAVLLECIGNLAANELFLCPSDAAPGQDEHSDAASGQEEHSDAASAQEEQDRLRQAKERILEGIRILRLRTDRLVIVSNEVNRAGCEYEGQTRLYQKLLGTLNQELCRQSDRVVEMVCGLAADRK